MQKSMSYLIRFSFLGLLGCQCIAPGIRNDPGAGSAHPAELGARPWHKPDIDKVLDAFHLAASRADLQEYFELLAPDVIFMGTAAEERWTLEEFRNYVMPYFSKGIGWTYVPSDRHISFTKDGQYAWFDERLSSHKYGELRGSGVLRREYGVWKIVFYNMMFPIPNDMTKKVVHIIRNKTEKPAPPEILE